MFMYQGAHPPVGPPVCRPPLAPVNLLSEAAGQKEAGADF